MIIIAFQNLKNLNISLQVGDAVYARSTFVATGAIDEQAGSHNTQDPNYTATGQNHYVGILRKITDKGNNEYDLHVDEVDANNPGTYVPVTNDFIMFSKFNQGDSGLLGYYAEAKFKNDSREKAELYAVSSEIIINSN